MWTALEGNVRDRFFEQDRKLYAYGRLTDEVGLNQHGEYNEYSKCHNLEVGELDSILLVAIYYYLDGGVIGLSVIADYPDKKYVGKKTGTL